MNRSELAIRLVEHGIAPSLFSMDGDWTHLASDGYLIAEEGDVWLVQYCERGETREIARFASEAMACEFLYCKLTDPRMLQQLRSRAE